MHKMYKIAISGKAGSGKDTFAKLLRKQFNNFPGTGAELVALADPIKEIIRIMFPRTKKQTLYGPSELRKDLVPNAFKNGVPLTYRMLLQDLGTEVGRGYSESIWLDVTTYKSEKAADHFRSSFIITDVRFVNEFNHFKNLGYNMIRIKRDSLNKMNHSSETEQDSISDNDFDFVVDNNGTKSDLKEIAANIVQKLK